MGPYGISNLFNLDPSFHAKNNTPVAEVGAVGRLGYIRGQGRTDNHRGQWNQGEPLSQGLWAFLVVGLRPPSNPSCCALHRPSPTHI